MPHVSSADDGRRIAGEVGTGSYVLQTGGKLAPSLVDANTVRIATGDMIVQGRHIGVTAPEDVKVASGSQGKKRMDYICVHYTRDVSGSSPTLVEKVEWKVLQGTPGSSAAAPSVPKGSILDGGADVSVPICSVTFDGLTTGQPKLLIPTLTPLATLGDSVSQFKSGYVRRTVDSGYIEFCRVGGIVVMNMYNVTAKVSGSWGTTLVGTVPEGFRPNDQIRQRCQVANTDGDRASGLWVQPSGAMYISNFGGTGLSGTYSFSCTACWPAA
ncbi:hypothetical protein [Collinsella aerofaciens]|uniref:hypothetical protein n=1 Tax=Collinsella aerofaciens TaxID=74426 RepID=UPI00232C4853|nr:hypothetical protein [Collinsella aerofaciens]MDB1844285.1 hypothetical protein [Collinsella aerofaciens]